MAHTKTSGYSTSANESHNVDLRAVSFNLHGFNQGGTLLKEFCENKTCNIIFVQEHWLTPASMYKLHNLSVHYSCFGVSAMESAISTGIIKGRPYGGSAFLVRNDLIPAISNVLTFERLVSFEICDVLFVNVYLPCEDGSVDAVNTLFEIIANVSDIIEQSSAEFICFGGDLNVNLDDNTPHAAALNDFLRTYKLIVPNGNKDILYTFFNVNRGHYSKIDFLCFSKNLKNYEEGYCALDEPLNHSDHLPLALSICFPTNSHIYKFLKTGSLKSKDPSLSCPVDDAYRFRWDHADINMYYNVTGRSLCSIYNKIIETHDLRDKRQLTDHIESLYQSTVAALQNASKECIPCIPSHYLKVWWSNDLTEKKKQAIDSHKIWVEAGKPKSGEIFINKNRNKLNYKYAIKNAKNTLAHGISDHLHESLQNKNFKSFWGTWRNKVCKQTKMKIQLENNYADDIAAEKFAQFFKSVSSPNSPEFDIDKKKKFNDEFKTYSGNYMHLEKYDLNVETLTIAASKLSKGKSAGCDGLTTEHLINCHPIIFPLLSKLFKMMLLNGFVPSDFGRGITIPIPKNDTLRGAHPIESFRGITLSPILSKLFEHCILLLFSEYFRTSDNQFGFKSKVGCPHAIYTLRKVIDHYITNDSTVNLCFLDMAKGFDKINNNVLMLKLMKLRVPANLIMLLNYWFSISYSVVRWGRATSQPYRILSGVRQGGVLSPTLFAIYVDNFLQSFKSFGCSIFGLSVSALMYADDLILLAPSITELQNMLNMCCNELKLLDLKINCTKSVALRIGKRYRAETCTLNIMNDIIVWSEEAKYLGVYIKSGWKFSVCFEKTKAKFYRAANAILGKLQKLDNTSSTMHLLSSIALPILIYSIEALALTKSQLLTLDHSWSRLFMKVYKTFDMKIVKHCQFYTGLLPIRCYYVLRKMSFINNIADSKNNLLRTLHAMSAGAEISALSSQYNNISPSTFVKTFNFDVRAHFNAEIANI